MTQKTQQQLINEAHMGALFDFHAWAEVNLTRVTHEPMLVIEGVETDADYRVFHILECFSRYPIPFNVLFQKVEAERDYCLADQQLYQGKNDQLSRFMRVWQQVYISGYGAALRWMKRHYPDLLQAPNSTEKQELEHVKSRSEQKRHATQIKELLTVAG